MYKEENSRMTPPEGIIAQRETPSKKELIIARLKTSHPDEDFEDDEKIYNRIAEDFDTYEKDIAERKKNDEAITNLFASDPRSAAFLMNWRKGEDPVVQLIRAFGDDFREALDDPDMQEKFAKARQEYLARQMKEKELEEQAQTNLATSLDNLEKVQQQGGYTDEQANEVFERFAQIVDDAILSKVAPETWQVMFKAMNYDKDLSTAAMEGEVRGRNAKIDANKRKMTVPEGVPPMLGGEGSDVRPPKRPDYGALDRFATDEDIWTRGRMNRIKRS